MLLKVIERSLKSYCSWPNVSTLQSSVFIRDDRCEDIGSISIPWRTMSYTLKDHVLYPEGPCHLPSRTMSYTLKDHVLYPQGPRPIPSRTTSYTLKDHVLYPQRPCPIPSTTMSYTPQRPCPIPSTTMSYTLKDHVLEGINMMSSSVLEGINMDRIFTTITPDKDTRLKCRNVGSWTITF